MRRILHNLLLVGMLTSAGTASAAVISFSDISPATGIIGNDGQPIEVVPGGFFGGVDTSALGIGLLGSWLERIFPPSQFYVVERGGFDPSLFPPLVLPLLPTNGSGFVTGFDGAYIFVTLHNFEGLDLELERNRFKVEASPDLSLEEMGMFDEKYSSGSAYFSFPTEAFEGNDLSSPMQLTLFSVPEPSGAALVSLAAFSILALRRRN